MSTLRFLSLDSSNDIVLAHLFVQNEEDPRSDGDDCHPEFYGTRTGSGKFRAPLPTLIDREDDDTVELDLDEYTRSGDADQTNSYTWLAVGQVRTRRERYEGVQAIREVFVGHAHDRSIEVIGPARYYISPNNAKMKKPRGFWKEIERKRAIADAAKSANPAKALLALASGAA